MNNFWEQTASLQPRRTAVVSVTIFDVTRAPLSQTLTSIRKQNIALTASDSIHVCIRRGGMHGCAEEMSEQIPSCHLGDLQSCGGLSRPGALLCCCTRPSFAAKTLQKKKYGFLPSCIVSQSEKWEVNNGTMCLANS